MVASLVQAEAGGSADAPKIAAVILNRYRQGTPLQIDATLCYSKGGCPPLPSNADKAIDSPYNTYKVTGLPPTPIMTVTEPALQAALHPAAVPYLFYVTGKDGVTYFATTLRGAPGQHPGARGPRGVVVRRREWRPYEPADQWAHPCSRASSVTQSLTPARPRS